MVRKTFRLTPDQQAKRKRLVQHTGHSESEIIRGALEAMPEDIDPVRMALMARGVILPKDASVTREEAKRTYEAYLKQIGDRHIGLIQAVLEERATQQE